MSRQLREAQVFLRPTLSDSYVRAVAGDVRGYLAAVSDVLRDVAARGEPGRAADVRALAAIVGEAGEEIGRLLMPSRSEG
jgi:alkylation response protein AidB-like acyl-CoA dehydrogenase